MANATRSEQPWWRMKLVENLAETLTGAWWRMGGQMRMFPVELCREIEKLHDDMSYVLIGGQK